MPIKKLLIVIGIFTSMTCMAQASGDLVNLDEVDRIRIIDFQNFNFSWSCGRTYEIVKRNGEFRMELTDQFRSPISDSSLVSIPQIDTLDVRGLGLFDVAKVLIRANPDIGGGALGLANYVIWKKHMIGNDPQARIAVDSFRSDRLLALVDAINDQKSRSFVTIVENLGMDSEWVSKNASRLFDSYKLPDVEPTDKQRDYCLSCFLDKRKVITAGLLLVGGHNSSDYPYMEIQFIQSGDTLTFSTDNPYPLSMPWMLNDSIKYYNPKISILLADILPDLIYSNKTRLSGDYTAFTKYKSVEEIFTKRMLYRFCTEFKGKKKRRKRVYIDVEKVDEKH
ncbi:MAG: hypothetical protein HEP71_25845 [Roseivirga sp.]|nr:hypothetical protein [Roseivirga sp.]